MHGLYLLWFVHERQMSPALVASVLAVGDLSLTALEIPTGWLADRFGHRRSLIAGSSAQIAGMLCCWLGEGVPSFVAASLLIALGDALRSGADQALLYRSCVAAGCVEAFRAIEARTSAIEQAALVALVLLGGAIVHRWGFGAGWAAETVLCGTGLVLALLMVEPPATGESRDATASQGTTPPLSIRMGLLVLPAALLGAASSAASFLLQTAGGADAPRMTTLVAGITLAEAAGSAAAMRIVPAGAGARIQWVLLTLGTALGAITLATPVTAIVAIGLAFLAGVSHPLRAAAIQSETADGWRARTASAASACDLLLSTLTLPLAGLWRAGR